jgi:hypothetical protein
VYFCIRDDDTSFFTLPEELERLYGEITQWGPVSLAIVPFHRAGTSKSVPEAWRGRWSVHPLHQNRALVAYLRAGIASGRYEAMLHGYHHDDPSGRAEFSDGRGLVRKVSEGRKYLEDVLGAPIRVFVAPKNVIGRDGLRAIVHEGLHLAGTIGVRNGWPLLSLATWKNWLKVRRWRNESQAAIPWILDLSDHREITGNPVTPLASFKTSKANFDSALAVDGVFCLFTHYWELSAPSARDGELCVGEHLRQLVELARSSPRVLWRTVGDVVCQSRLD